MLLQGFTGFDDVIIVFVTSQTQNIYFEKFNKKLPQQAKILTSSLTKRFLGKGGGGWGGKFAPTPRYI